MIFLFLSLFLPLPLSISLSIAFYLLLTASLLFIALLSYRWTEKFKLDSKRYEKLKRIDSFMHQKMNELFSILVDNNYEHKNWMSSSTRYNLRDYWILLGKLVTENSSTYLVVFIMNIRHLIHWDLKECVEMKIMLVVECGSHTLTCTHIAIAGASIWSYWWSWWWWLIFPLALLLSFLAWIHRSDSLFSSIFDRFIFDQATIYRYTENQYRKKGAQENTDRQTTPTMENVWKKRITICIHFSFDANSQAICKPQTSPIGLRAHFYRQP